MFESLAERRVNNVLEGQPVRLTQAFDEGGNIGVESQRGAHTSKHRLFDALMSKDIVMGLFCAAVECLRLDLLTSRAMCKLY